MIKLNPSPLSVENTTPVVFKSTPRLLILIPADTDYSAATQRIWQLASATNMSVQLITLCKDPGEEPGLRRRLVTLASLLQDGKFSVDAKVMIGTNWVAAVKSIFETGDRIVCFAEQRTGLLQRPLSQILESNLKVPLHILSDPTLPKSKSNRLTQVGSWLGFLVIIIGFGILQTRITQVSGGSLQSILLILSLLPEFWLIWIWNGLFG
jgi:hypothetical protein